MSNMENGKDLIVLTPLVHNDVENVFRIDRLHSSQDRLPHDVLHVAGGEHTGIIIRKQSETDGLPELKNVDSNLTLDFNVHLLDPSTQTVKQESRSLKFSFSTDTAEPERHYHTQEFFKNLINEFPRDYINFVKKLLKMMQQGFTGLLHIQVFMKMTSETPFQDLETSLETEVVTSESVKEVLEHAYPNGMLAENLANALQSSLDEVFTYLDELKSKNIVHQLESGQWIRVDPTTNLERSMVKQMPKIHDMPEPTVAIITALYAEKLAVDAIIEDKKTFVRYKTDGESNIYTLGKVGHHHVVATKLSAVGCTRSASIAAGSVTTRLLGCFQEIQHVLVVGVGGAVSHFTDKSENVRLGDVVVSAVACSKNKFAYAFSEALDSLDEMRAMKLNGYRVKLWAPKDPVLADLARELGQEAGDDRCSLWQDVKTAAIGQLCLSVDDKQDPSPPLQRPPGDTDVLRVPLGGGVAKMATVSHPDGPRLFSRLHVGPIGCGWVARDGDSRMDFAHKFKIKAFDVDFQTVIESIEGNRIGSWALIRGACDYFDGASKGKEWQPYAALQAAVVAKLLLRKLPPRDVSNGEV